MQRCPDLLVTTCMKWVLYQKHIQFSDAALRVAGGHENFKKIMIMYLVIDHYESVMICNLIPFSHTVVRSHGVKIH